jgi:glutamate N-acetyltransferase/amino-acid N-acetyltransferase
MTASSVAEALGIDQAAVLPCSTGVIGGHLPVQAIRRAVPRLIRSLGEKEFYGVARAMMTTDTFPKIVAAWGRIRGRIFRVMGLAKGAGMIAPNMATMLSFVLTDARVAPSLLDEVLGEAAGESLNLVTVDGDTSTNDTCILMANGQAETEELTLDSSPEDVTPFREALGRVLGGVAEMLARDGEGATKLVRVRVRGAETPAAAEAAAKAVADSPLVKTAIFGQDPNWGRIMAALGRCGVDFDPAGVDIYIGKMKVVRKGQGKGPAAEKRAARIMGSGEVIITVDLGQGPAGVEVLTCDLSPEYVAINADYRT